MFGLDALKSLKTQQPKVKVIAGNNFLNALGSIEDIKIAKAASNTEISSNKDNIINPVMTNFQDKYNLIVEEAKEIFLDALEYIDSYQVNELLNLLREAADKFTEALKIKKSKPEPYFYLSYIFFILKDMPLAIKYFKVAEFMNPELYGLAQLKKNIDDYINGSIQKETVNTKDKILPKNVVTTAQPYTKPVPARPSVIPSRPVMSVRTISK